VVGTQYVCWSRAGVKQSWQSITESNGANVSFARSDIHKDLAEGAPLLFDCQISVHNVLNLVQHGPVLEEHRSLKEADHTTPHRTTTQHIKLNYNTALGKGWQNTGRRAEGKEDKASEGKGRRRKGKGRQREGKGRQRSGKGREGETKGNQRE